ncbi:MAG: AbrB/MazE/SpoVT family DNA-binding domain-containing protein [Mycobacteriales bacterium]
MRTTIDKAGRLVIPKRLRDQVGLAAGEVEIEVVGSALRIEPAGSARLVEENGLLVIAEDGPPLTVDDVRELRLADQK